MKALTDLEFLLIDELYFVTPFTDLLAAVHADREVLVQALTSLLERGLVSQMIYDTQQKDFVKTESGSFADIESGFYVATKAGLLEHNTRM